MLFTEAELYTGTKFESVLSEAVYLTEEESMIKPKAIPVVENSRIGTAVVDFKDISTLAEDYGISYIDAMGIVANANDINPVSLAVSVDEAQIIEMPYLVESLNNVVVKPIAENDYCNMVVSEAISMFLESGDEAYLDGIEFFALDESKIKEILKSKGVKKGEVYSNTVTPGELQRGSAHVDRAGANAKPNAFVAPPAQEKYVNPNPGINSIKGKAGQNIRALAKAEAEASKVAATAEKVANDSNAKPGVISRVIASLRRWSEKIQSKYNDAPAEKRSIWMKIKNKIASLIEKLTKKLQSDEKYAAANAYHDAQKKA